MMVGILPGAVIDKRLVQCVSKLEQTQWLEALRKQAKYGAKKSPKPQRLQVVDWKPATARYCDVYCKKKNS